MGKKSIIAIGILLWTCISCREELFEDSGVVLPEGKFVVDYAANPETATRAINDGVSRGKRINSLTYLLYRQVAEGENEVQHILEKRREIPGLAGEEEKWPLTRENMSWEQREALKDTLQQGITYRVVFVANADPSLWKNTDPLLDIDTYETARLKLTDQPFNDTNLFYLFQQEINSDDQMANRDQPYSCPVSLNRIVTRTDFFFEELPEWSDDDNTKVKDYITPFVNTIISSQYDGLTTEVVDSTSAFLDKLGSYFQKKKDEQATVEPGQDENGTSGLLVEENSGEDNSEGQDEEVEGGEEPSVDEPAATDWGTYVKAIEALKIEINKPDGKLSFFDLLSKAEEDKLNLSTQVQLGLLTECVSNVDLQTIWKQSNKEGKFARVVYKPMTTEEGTSSTSNACNYYYLAERTIGEAEYKKSPCIEADVDTLFNTVTYNGFNWVGFSSTAADWIQSIEWYDDNQNGEIPVSTVPFDLSASQQGMNEKCVYAYRPISGLVLQDNWDQIEGSKKDQKILCNLDSALPFEMLNEGETPILAGDDAITAFKTAIKEAMLDSKGVTGYGENLTEVSLLLHLPDVSKSEVLKINSLWEKKN